MNRGVCHYEAFMVNPRGVFSKNFGSIFFLFDDLTALPGCGLQFLWGTVTHLSMSGPRGRGGEGGLRHRELMLA